MHRHYIWLSLDEDLKSQKQHLHEPRGLPGQPCQKSTEVIKSRRESRNEFSGGHSQAISLHRGRKDVCCLPSGRRFLANQRGRGEGVPSVSPLLDTRLDSRSIRKLPGAQRIEVQGKGQTDVAPQISMTVKTKPFSEEQKALAPRSARLALSARVTVQGGPLADLSHPGWLPCPRRSPLGALGRPQPRQPRL